MPDASPYLVVAGLVSFQVLANGQPLDDTYRVLSVSVTKAVNKISSARFELVDGDPATGNFPALDSPTLVPGTPIVLLAGYDNQNSVIFQGIITKLSVASLSAQGVGVTVACHDLAIKVSGNRKSRVFVHETTSAALQQLVAAYPDLTADFAATAVVHEQLIQYQTTDWDFLVMQAEANGQVVLNDSGKISTRVPSTNSPADLLLEYGTNVYRFALDLDARFQHQTVKGRAWSPGEQRMLEVIGEGTVLAPLGNLPPSEPATTSNPTEYVFETSATDQASLQALADAYCLKLALAGVQGTLVLPGSALALPGSTVALAGIGRRFSGQAYVSGVTHTIGTDWLTEVTLGLDARWFTEHHPDAAAPAQVGPLPGIQGLYHAVVQQLRHDPATEFRVQVAVPALQGQLLWARLGYSYISPGGGSFFHPETGDEVVLGFLDNDLQQPVVLGTLTGSARPPA